MRTLGKEIKYILPLEEAVVYTQPLMPQLDGNRVLQSDERQPRTGA